MLTHFHALPSIISKAKVFTFVFSVERYVHMRSTFEMFREKEVSIQCILHGKKLGCDKGWSTISFTRAIVVNMYHGTSSPLSHI